MKKGNEKGREQVEPREYPGLLVELKGRIRTARVKAALAVNAQLILLYWSRAACRNSPVARRSALGQS